MIALQGELVELLDGRKISVGNLGRWHAYRVECRGESCRRERRAVLLVVVPLIGTEADIEQALQNRELCREREQTLGVVRGREALGQHVVQGVDLTRQLTGIGVGAPREQLDVAREMR